MSRHPSEGLERLQKITAIVEAFRAFLDSAFRAYVQVRGLQDAFQPADAKG